MTSKGYKFEFWPTLIMVPMFILLISLGFWQLYRLNVKNTLLENIQSKIASSPSHLSLHHLSDLEGMQYGKYIMKGEFLHQKTMFLYGSNPSKPSEHGYFVLTPFVTENQKYILLNRGWIPPTTADVFVSKNPVYGPSQVVAILMLPSAPSALIPKNDPKRNIWFSIDMKDMSEFAGCSLEKNLYMTLIDCDNDASQDLTKHSVRDFCAHIQNHHLIYAIIWFSLAIGLLWIYFVYHRK
jgi:surfeit locus 1 family protein